MAYLGVILLCFLGAVYSSPLRNGPTESTCGYDSCPARIPGMINVHLVSHTHDDVGWLKTPDEYFYGDKNNIQRAGVQYILDTVIDELEKNPQRRFIYVETSFFYKWWNSRNESIHVRVQQLVQSGQLEFVSGGWCMNDEAGNYYVDTIDQMTWGLRFLNDTFGPCGVPRVAWQIDPFGHSREQASIFAQLGFDGLFLGRIDHRDKDHRKSQRSMEMLWQASPNLGIDAEIFTGVLPNVYGPPAGFNFDILSNDEPIRDNRNLKNYNVDERVNAFIEIVYSQAEFYASDDIIMTMGEDFHYQAARTWFINLDKLINYVNSRQGGGSNVNVFYSTPSCYLKALNDAALTWPVKNDDFFPYSSNSHSYWTGYFTSRPALKGYVKVANNVLQTAKQVSSYANLGPDNDANNLAVLKRFQGDAQHHDAVSGTSKQAVAYDYAESLATGVDKCVESINSAFNNLLSIGTTALPNQAYCPYLNVSYCDATETQASFVITVYNPLGHNITSHVRVPISATSTYIITRPDGTVVESQIVPLPQEIIATPEKHGSATSDLVFSVDLPPSGLNSYFVQSSESIPTEQKIKLSEIPKADNLVIQNEFLTVTVDGNTGLLTNIAEVATGKIYNVKQNFYYYLGYPGGNRNESDRASGAYIFRPYGTDVYPVGSSVTATLVSGNVVQEIQQTFGDFVSQVIRLYPGETGVELEWLVGPIPVLDGWGKEVISRIETDFVTNGLFYTDSNGREILERRRDYRPTWDFEITEPVAENYYPVNSRIYIQDAQQDAQLTVATDRSQGGSSILDGSIELMLHRRLLYDDGFGVGEALLEPGVDGKGLVVRGKHRLLVSSISEAAPAHRNVGLQMSNPPLITVAPFSGTFGEYSANFLTTYTALVDALPPNVNLVTVEPWKDGTVLIRLEHFFEQNDDPTGLSQAVTINLQNIFSSFQIVEATETTLGGQVWMKDKKRFSWNVGSTNNIPINPAASDDPLSITLTPMQIKTFVVQVAVINSESDDKTHQYS